MLEIETKYPLPDLSRFEERLRQLGAGFLEEQVHVDTYLNAPDRDFARTDEALRLRQLGQQNLLTYKGPRREAGSKTRTEVEVACASGAQAASELLQLFQHLGYRRVAVVSKQRRLYQLALPDFQVHVCVDRVAELGLYAELEIVAAESQLTRAQQVLAEMAQQLGLDQSESRSYLEMLLQHAVPPGGIPA